MPGTCIRTEDADETTQAFNTEVMCAHIMDERGEKFSWMIYEVPKFYWEEMSIHEAVCQMHRAIRRLPPGQHYRVTMEIIPKGDLHELEFNLYTSSYGGPSFSLYAFGDFGLKRERRFELLVQRK